MRTPRYYVYDPDRCMFVPAPPSRVHPLAEAALVLTAAFFLAGAILLAADLLHITPQEAVLRAENVTLLGELHRSRAEASICDARLEALLRRAGNPEGTRPSPPTRPFHGASMGLSGAGDMDFAIRPAEALFVESSETLFDVEQLIYTQNEGYRVLLDLVERRDARMMQLPAILPADGPIASNYGMRRHPVLRVMAMHHGIDLLVPTGTPVVATGDGVVAAVGFNITYGKHVKIAHPAVGYTTVYAHLSDIPEDIRPGRTVKRREQIGLSGDTGRVTGPHLHYEVHSAEGHTVHPLSFILPHMRPNEYANMLRVSGGPMYD